MAEFLFVDVLNELHLCKSGLCIQNVTKLIPFPTIHSIVLTFIIIFPHFKLFNQPLLVPPVFFCLYLHLFAYFCYLFPSGGAVWFFQAHGEAASVWNRVLQRSTAAAAIWCGEEAGHWTSLRASSSLIFLQHSRHVVQLRSAVECAAVLWLSKTIRVMAW